MVELSVPGGSYSITKQAFEMGADSVHICLEGFSLGVDSQTLNIKDLESLADLKSKGKIYCTLDRFFHNNSLNVLDSAIKELPKDLFDSFIVSDIGTLGLIRKYFPKAKLTLSAFANCLNSQSASVFSKLGFNRVILGHETPYKDIEIIKRNNPDLEIEAQVHGSMCMSYSGRSLLSTHLNRKENLSDLALEEEQRKDSFFPVKETDGFITILSSKQISMLGHLMDLKSAGVSVFRIENPRVTQDYLTNLVPLYRKTIDSSSQGEPLSGYTTGFFFEKGPIDV